MDIELVLNELSLSPCASDSFAARDGMSGLLRTISAASKAGATRVLRVHRDLNSELLAPDYTISRWRNDNVVDREEQRLFRTLTTKAPYLTDLPDQTEKANRIECFCGGDCAIGLGIAWLLEAFSISLNFSSRWDAPSLQVQLTELNERGDLEETTVKLPHASCADHVSANARWFQERLVQARDRRFDNIRNGSELWDAHIQLFEHLRFCDEIERQLDGLNRFPEMLIPILKRLHELNEYCRQWKEGPFDPDRLVSKTSVESQATLNMYGTERTFTWNNRKHLFSWHVRLTPGAWRIYFEPDVQQRVFYIGYIGGHLPTVKYKT